MKAMLRFAGYCGTRGPAYLSLGEQKDGGLQKTRKPQREKRKERWKQRWERETEKTERAEKSAKTWVLTLFAYYQKGFLLRKRILKIGAG